MKRLIKWIFKNRTPFCIHLYERMDGTHYDIGLRFNKVTEPEKVGIKYVVGLFYGKRYRVFTWHD